MIRKLADTRLEPKSESEALVIRPMTLKQPSRDERIAAAADEIMDAHDETFRKLAK